MVSFLELHTYTTASCYLRCAHNHITSKHTGTQILCSTSAQTRLTCPTQVGLRTTTCIRLLLNVVQLRFLEKLVPKKMYALMGCHAKNRHGTYHTAHITTVAKLGTHV